MYSPSMHAPQVEGIKLYSPQSLEKRFWPIFPFQHFNAVQSTCFTCVYGSTYNVVVAAPTGSGKTVIFELAVCKLLASCEKKDFKIVYQAPTKALCAERTRDWQKKFKPLGLQIAELTGDTSAAGVRSARAASIIVTTPEKWDSITRKWSDHGALLKTVKLVLIDEVHILKDSRGATLETVVSRMKTLGSEVRFVALSATIPNSADVAQWLGLTHTCSHVPAKTFVCGDNYRPVHLEKIVIGYNVGGGNEHSFDSLLDDQLASLIVKHAQGKPVLIFCFTRKSTESAAAALSEYWNMCSVTQRPWPAPQVTIRSSGRLKNLVASGVAFHHGGLEKHDRTSIEEAFLRGHLSIVCCTSTLAVGVNLPCHTVILKGTMGYQNGKFSEYDELEVMQMIGRAGRPQFDTSATAIILTRAENRTKYLNIESGCQTVESTLHLNLIEHLNSEIVLGTVTSLAKAVQWLQGTFLAVRLRLNPDHYKLTDEPTQARTTDEQLEEACTAAISRLSDVGLIQYLDHSESEFRATQYGSAMSAYMVRFETMVMILGLPKSLKMENLVNSLCHASEFDELRIKSTERQAYRDLNKSQDIPFKFKENIVDTWQKISVLIQTELSRGTIPYQQRMAIEARQAIERIQRLLMCYIACAIADNNGHGTKVALEFSRSLSARAWEGHVAQLCQIPDIGPVNMRKLADKQVTNVLDLTGLSAVDIERLLSKNPPAAMKIADALKSFPRLFLDGRVEKVFSDERAESTEVQARANAKVTLGCTNKQGLLRWQNKVPSVTFLAMTTEGTLLHIWRGKLEQQDLQVSFCVPGPMADQVCCEFSCDEIVGTSYSLLLPSVEVSSEAAASWPTVRAPFTGKRPTVKLSDMQGTAPAKRQKLTTYPTHPITVGSTVFDCIDLSALDENDVECPHTPLSKKNGSPSSTVAADEPFQDSYTLGRLSVMYPRNCSGGGTEQDPLTINEEEDEDIDAFDADIFDKLEMPVVNEATAETVSDSTTETPQAHGSHYKVATPNHKSVLNQADSFNLDSPESVPSLADSSSMVIPCGNISGPQTVETHQNVEISNEVGSFTPDENQNFSEKESSGRKEEDDHGFESQDSTRLETHQGTPRATAPEAPEPCWVNVSNSSIVDFLRGHVTFV
ncbi:ATP-dependent DNA helicase MER3 [Sporothrix epigloea]|uniref:DNA 3'-5' helicase n=1 Tax=Sporothrix epigloea TaxID=1892477 RepID=A0ABP0D7F1_9PEZI